MEYSGYFRVFGSIPEAKIPVGQDVDGTLSNGEVDVLSCPATGGTMAGSLTLEQLINFLLETSMFGHLDSAELSQIVHIMQIQRLRDGVHIFNEGDAGDAWYVVFEGEVQVMAGGGEEAVLATLGPKSCFGEMAILDNSSRSASVRASKESTLFRFPRKAFEGLLAQENIAAYKLVYQMALVLVARQRDMNLTLMKQLNESIG